jgi:hypothetical protein
VFFLVVQLAERSFYVVIMSAVTFAIQAHVESVT